MTDFSKLSPDEQKLIISIPYRVGTWVSYVDDNTKSRMDDKREQQALELVISRMATSHRKMPFAAMIMNEVQKNKSLWPTWAQQVDEEAVLQDIQKAVDICRQKMSPADIKQYKQAVWHIALAVAQAYGEHVDPDNEMHVDRFFSWLASFITAPSLRKTPENMSPKEKTALKKLRAILKG